MSPFLPTVPKGGTVGLQMDFFFSSFSFSFSSFTPPTFGCKDDLSVCTVLYCVLYFTDSTVLYCTVLYCTVLYCTVLYCTVLYCTVLYCTVLYCTVLYCTVLYCTVLLLLLYFILKHQLVTEDTTALENIAVITALEL